MLPSLATGWRHLGNVELYEPERHEPLTRTPWKEAEAKAAIEEIVADALERFDPARFWHTHPLEDCGHDGATSLYWGAAGAIWALELLARAGATRARGEFSEVLPCLLERNRAEVRTMPYPEAPSFLMGEVGALLVLRKLMPSAEVADRLFGRIEADGAQPVRELMWGTPGCLLAALFLHEQTKEAKWRELFLRHAERLWSAWRPVADLGFLWTQELYGKQSRYLGLVHGFAGNVFPLIVGSVFFEPERRASLFARACETLVATAYEVETRANWPAKIGRARPLPIPHLVQQCHGAPGMVTALAQVPVGINGAADRLLEKGGELIWTAGPLRKGSNLCHGTAGNGYALLKLYRRTGDPKWLDRARAFAMHGMAQCRWARRHYGQGRYSLWTGDLGLACYLWDCIHGEARFPTLDTF